MAVSGGENEGLQTLLPDLRYRVRRGVGGHRLFRLAGHQFGKTRARSQVQPVGSTQPKTLLPMVAPKWVAYPYANEFSWMLMMASFYLEERSRRLIMVAFCNDELSFSSNYCFTSSQDLRLSKHVNDDVYNSIYHDWSLSSITT